MVYDSVGASELPFVYKDELRSAGVSVRAYNPVGFRSLFSPRSILFRNHKKTTIIDKKVAFVGGMNVTGEYCTSKVAGGIDRFRDTHARICGPAVDDIRKNFMESLCDLHPEASEDDLIEEAPAMPLPERIGSKGYRIPKQMLID